MRLGWFEITRTIIKFHIYKRTINSHRMHTPLSICSVLHRIENMIDSHSFHLASEAPTQSFMPINDFHVKANLQVDNRTGFNRAHDDYFREMCFGRGTIADITNIDLTLTVTAQYWELVMGQGSKYRAPVSGITLTRDLRETWNIESYQIDKYYSKQPVSGISFSVNGTDIVWFGAAY